MNIPQIAMATYFMLMLLALVWMFFRPFHMRVGPAAVRRFSLYAFVAMIGEVLLLSTGGFWG